jgi:CHAD domain-containing protein
MWHSPVDAKGPWLVPEGGAVPRLVLAATEEGIDRSAALYFDTPDFRLSRQGGFLARAACGEKWHLCLAAGGESICHVGGSGRGIPEDLQGALALLVGDDPLGAQADLEVVERRGVLRGDVVLAQAKARVLKGPAGGAGRLSAIWLEGSVKAVSKRAAKLTRKLGPPAPVVSPLGLALGGRPAEAAAWLAPPLPNAAGKLLSWLVSGDLVRIQVAALGAMLRRDPEDIHQLRVGLRRLWAHLSMYRPFLDRSWLEGVGEVASSLRRLAGRARDLDVRADLVAGLAGGGLDEQAMRVFRKLKAERSEARRKLVEALGSAEIRGWLEELRAAVSRPPWSAELPRSDRRWAKRRVQRSWRRLEGLLWPGEDPASLHRLRIATKRCRYIAEAAHSAGLKGAGELASDLAGLQDALGRERDLTAAKTWLEQEVAEAGFAEAKALRALLVALEAEIASARGARIKVLSRLQTRQQPVSI